MARLKTAWLAILIASFMVLSACAHSAQTEEPEEQSQSLTVALVPYVPDIEHFEDSVREAWAAEHPDVTLDFVEWNCYHEDLPDDLDVFVYDAMYLETFADQGALLPLDDGDVQDADDLVPFAYEACRVDGQLYAAPQLLCTDLLYTREGDELASQVENIDDLHAVLGDHSFKEVASSEGTGLLTEQMSWRSKSCYYLQALIDAEGRYISTLEPVLEAGLSPEAASCLEALKVMGAAVNEDEQVPDGGEQAACPHAKLFADGAGRAYYGFSESMHDMGDYATHVDFRMLGMTGNDDIPVFYADLVSVSAHIDPQKRDLAIDLLNVLISSDVLVSASLPAEDETYPQYLLLSRLSSYDALAQEYPIYAQLKELVSTPDGHVFRVMPDGLQIMEEYASALDESGIV